MPNRAKRVQEKPRLKDKLNLLGISAHPGTGQRPPSPLQEVGIEQEVLRQKLFREVANEQQRADRTRTTDPMGARERMQRLRDRVSQLLDKHRQERKRQE